MKIRYIGANRYIDRNIFEVNIYFKYILIHVQIIFQVYISGKRGSSLYNLFVLGDEGQGVTKTGCPRVSIEVSTALGIGKFIKSVGILYIIDIAQFIISYST